MKLSKQLVYKISVEARTAFIDNYVTKIVEDQRLSPEEENEIKAIAESLDIKVQIDDKTQRQLDKLKLYWALENLPLPTVQQDITIQKSEQCYFQLQNVHWYELRSVKQKTYSTRIRVAKGFYIGSKSSSYSTNEMKLIDNGSIYLTNKRIIYTGSTKNINIRLEKILNITPYSDGVEIVKETGKNPFIQLKEKADIFSIIIERLIREL